MRDCIRHFPPRNPDQIGSEYERLLAPNPIRQSRGIFYTPPAVVDYIVEHTLGPLLFGQSPVAAKSLRILDPACGCGAFLLGAHRWLCRWYAGKSGRAPTRTQRQAIAHRHLMGIDIDPAAVELARQALGEAADVAPHQLEDNIRLGDALLDHDEWFDGGFNALVTNPPYVNIRRLTSSTDAARAAAYRRRYTCASGAFDLYVLFLERSIAALRPGGRLGAIVPNKLATLDYARPCRELLLTRGTLDLIADVSHVRIFGDAEVYPHILVWTKRPPQPAHMIRIVRPPVANSAKAQSRAVHLNDDQPTLLLQSQQRADRGLILDADLPVESRVNTAPLGSVATIHSGATGFLAQELAARLIEREGRQDNGNPQFDFITSGNIDPYSIRLGNVRFIGRKLHWPLLSAADPILTIKKRKLYAAQKIVLSGMSRRLEAALDNRGLALGVQVYAVTDWKIDPHYLLGLLNSSLLSHLFRLRFAAKKLAGGYYSLSKKQLAQLPIRLIDLQSTSDLRMHHRLIQLVQQRLKESADRAALAILDKQIDDVVLQLYRVASEESAATSDAA